MYELLGRALIVILSLTAIIIETINFLKRPKDKPPIYRRGNIIINDSPAPEGTPWER